MNKFIGLIIVGFVSLIGVDIKQDNWEIIDIDKEKECSLLLCEVKSNEEYGFKDDMYIPCESVYDRTDFILVDKKIGKEKDLLAVELYYDDVISIQQITDYKMMVKK